MVSHSVPTTLATVLLAALAYLLQGVQLATALSGVPPPGTWFAAAAVYVNTTKCTGQPFTRDRVFFGLPSGVCFPLYIGGGNLTYDEQFESSVRGGPKKNITSIIFDCSEKNRAGSVGASDEWPGEGNLTCAVPKKRIKMNEYCFSIDDDYYLEEAGVNALAFKFSCLKMPDCRPQYTLKKAQCTSRIRTCRRVGLPMKWTGRGCRDEADKPLGDGGCQCAGYCGYKCQDACDSDSECFWNSGANECWSKAENTTGSAIQTCYPLDNRIGDSLMGLVSM